MGGVGVVKNQYREGDCLNRGLRQVADLKGGLARKKGEGGIFEGSLIPQCTLWSIMKVCITVILLCLNKFYIWENSGF